MAEVVKLRPEAITASFAPIPDLIKQLEMLLEEAKSGKLRACGWALVYEADAKPDGETASGFVRGPYTRFAMTHAIQELVEKWRAKQVESDG